VNKWICFNSICALFLMQHLRIAIEKQSIFIDTPCSLWHSCILLTRNCELGARRRSTVRLRSQTPVSSIILFHCDFELWSFYIRLRPRMHQCWKFGKTQSNTSRYRANNVSGHKHRRTDGRTDAQNKNTVPPVALCGAEAYKNSRSSVYRSVLG